LNILPANDQLSIESLAAAFRNVTNSYKFFWFLAILDHVQEEQSRIIAIDSLLARMVAWVWYPTSYFKLSFGKQDQLSLTVELLRQATGIEPSAGRQQVMQVALAELSTSSTVGRAIREIGRYVPTRFLRPFFANELTGLYDRLVDPTIQKLATEAFDDPTQPCLYKFISVPHSAIEIHERWHTYLVQNLFILKGFCLWHLLNYLQSNNPNVPNIATKLFEPTTRDLKQARRFWLLAFEHLVSPRCIYSGNPLTVEDFTLDHFLPWRFVGHDMLWNIVPTPKAVNSAKSDRLPDVTLYFDGFAKLQFEALQAVAAKKANQLMEDYVLLYKVDSVEALTRIDLANFSAVLKDTILPQVQLARNMGFSYGWRYH
jgi:hypothetical protein